MSSEDVTGPDATGPDLSGQHVTVWAFQLAGSDTSLCRCFELLSEVERARSARFTTAALRDGFVMAHGVKRTVISGCLDCAPDRLAFDTSADGKPFVASLTGEARDQGVFQFNLSHTGVFGDGFGLVATSFGAPVGVDVEQPRPVSEGLAERYFAKSEAAALQRYVNDRGNSNADAFLAYWTAKEACLKALGTGIKGGLDRFVLSGDMPAAGRNWPLVVTPHSAGPASGWSVARLDLSGVLPGQPAIGALAVAAPSIVVTVRPAPFPAPLS